MRLTSFMLPLLLAPASRRARPEDARDVLDADDRRGSACGAGRVRPLPEGRLYGGRRGRRSRRSTAGGAARQPRRRAYGADRDRQSGDGGELLPDTGSSPRTTQAGRPERNSRVSNIVAIGGGSLIQAKGSLVGGIGVSGAPGGDADEACAKAGIAAISDALELE